MVYPTAARKEEKDVILNVFYKSHEATDKACGRQGRIRRETGTIAPGPHSKGAPRDENYLF